MYSSVPFGFNTWTDTWVKLIEGPFRNNTSSFKTRANVTESKMIKLFIKPNLQAPGNSHSESSMSVKGMNNLHPSTAE